MIQIMDPDMVEKGCNFTDVCNAPLCPLDAESIVSGIWFPDEEICRSRIGSNLMWVKTQKKIQKKAVNDDKYFTASMMDRNIVVKRGILGLDPNKATPEDEIAWIEKHPGKKALTEEEKNVLREHFKKHVRPGE